MHNISAWTSLILNNLDIVGQMDLYAKEFHALRKLITINEWTKLTLCNINLMWPDNNWVILCINSTTELGYSATLI